MKKAIIEASFGTSHKNALENSVLALQKKIKKEFADHDVFTVITSGMVRSALKKQEIFFDDADTMLGRLKAEHYDEVIIQPTHMIPGIEYEKLCAAADKYKNDFSVLLTGTPLLDSKSDIEKVCRIIAEKYPDETVILMGHGTEHRSNEIYTLVSEICRKSGFNDLYVATVEAEPTIDDVIGTLKKDGISSVTLMPLMLVAGDHAENDMAGDQPDSWKQKLEANGFKVKCVLKGLGEYPEIQEIYCENIKELIREGK